MGAGALTIPQLGCGSGDGKGDDGDTGRLPDYEYDGPEGPDSTFETGVASGDPHADSVILWTAVHPGDLGGGPIELFVEVALDAAFEQRVAADYHETGPDRNYTFKVEATELEPGTTYFYRWRALGRTSPVGRTRTMPVDAARLRFAVAACSSYGFGYFHSYREIAERADLDLVLHLGDYIYEYGDGSLAGGGIRNWDPPHECVTLEDYRRRYAHYRRDRDLREAHRQHPWTTIWDDHEFANDPFIGGAENHDPDDGEGDWLDRIEAGLRAYDEWMPTRQGRDGDIYRRIDCGPQATILVVDINRPLLFPAAGDDADGAQTLGAQQAQWLDEQLAELSARDEPPRYVLLAQAKTFGTRPDGASESAYWHAASRERVLDAFSDAGLTELIVLTGDIHQGQALDVPRALDSYDPTTGEGSEAVELVCMSITTPGGTEDVDAIPNMVWANGLDKGYLVLDLDGDAFGADFFGTSFLDGDLGRPQRPTENVHASFTGVPGSHHVVTSADPVPNKPDAPPLAP